MKTELYIQTNDVVAVMEKLNEIGVRAAIVEAAPVVHGHWIYSHERECWVCSVCGQAALRNENRFQVLSDGCPRCRAKMCDEEGEE